MPSLGFRRALLAESKHKWATFKGMTGTTGRAVLSISAKSPLHSLTGSECNRLLTPLGPIALALSLPLAAAPTRPHPPLAAPLAAQATEHPEEWGGTSTHSFAKNAHELATSLVPYFLNLPIRPSPKN
jgi:hypothetical protein